MINSKDLTDEQLTAIKTWAEEGAQLPDIQKRLMGQFGMNVTYMDTRFLILDLGIDIKPEVEEEKKESEEGSPEVEEPEVMSNLDPNAPPGGSVTAQLDEVTQPGAMVSGTVTFSDGEKGRWMIDEMGRPGLDPQTPGYEPSNADLDAFETELRRLLEG